MTKCRTRFDWHELREDYAALSSVVKKVDQHVSPVILLSFANNLYFICMQLLYGISYVLFFSYIILLINIRITINFVLLKPGQTTTTFSIQFTFSVPLHSLLVVHVLLLCLLLEYTTKAGRHYLSCIAVQRLLTTSR